MTTETISDAEFNSGRSGEAGFNATVTREIEFVSVKCPRCPSWLNSYAAQAYHNRHVCN